MLQDLECFAEHQHSLSKKRSFNKRLVEISVSILSVYTEQVSKYTDSLRLLEKNSFIEVVFVNVSNFVVMENS